MKNYLTNWKSVFIVLVFAGTMLGSGCNQPAQQSSSEPNTANVNWNNKVIYELNVRQFTAEGTFKAFEEHLPRLKELGVDILWFMPIFPVGEKFRKATQKTLVEEIVDPEQREKYLGSYYAIQDYTAINPEFGTIEEFKSLVKKIHELDMFVILDIAVNHTAWDHVWIDTNPEFYTRIEEGTTPWNPEWMEKHPEFYDYLKETGYTYPIDGGETDWWDTSDLNYENEDLRNEMKKALKFWIEKCNIDGYRCDVAGKVPTDFWENAVEELIKIKPVFMLAEAESNELLVNAFDMDYTWWMMHTMNQIAKGEFDASYIDTVLENQTETYQIDDIRMYFTTNHDENSWNGTVFERYGDGAKTFSTLCFTLNGMPLLYSGQEVGLNKRLRFFEKDTIEWNESDLISFYKVLTNLKHTNPALLSGAEGGAFKKIASTNDGEVYAFMRIKGENKVLVILNLGGNNISETIEGEHMSGSYTDAFTGIEVTISNRLDLNMEPWEYRVYVK